MFTAQSAVSGPDVVLALSDSKSLPLTDLAHMFRHDIFCTEPFRIPLAGKLSLCCFDKTGTLTSDDLVVQGVAAVPVDNKATVGAGDKPDRHSEGNVAAEAATGPVDAELTSPLDLPGASVAALAGCHQLMVIDNELLGDPMDKAALGAVGWGYAADGLCISRAPGRRGALRILQRYPFSSELKRSSTVAIVDSVDGAPPPPALRLRALCKGAPEALRPLLKKVPEGYDDAFAHHASQGKRVLALAWRPLPDVDVAGARSLARSDVERDLFFAGFLVLHCPAKPESAGVLAALASASHDLQMITGDQLLTACHAATQLGLIKKPPLMLTLADPEQCSVASTSQLPPTLCWRLPRSDSSAHGVLPVLPSFEPSAAAFKMLATRYALCTDGDAFDKLYEIGAHAAALQHLSVLARMAPQQKELALLTLKQAGIHALMCGDGTNDVGKQADTTCCHSKGVRFAQSQPGGPPMADMRASLAVRGRKKELSNSPPPPPRATLAAFQNRPFLQFHRAPSQSLFVQVLSSDQMSASP